MIRRVPPPRYQAAEGRLVDYRVEFGSTDFLPTDIWTFILYKTYIPWETWVAYCSGGAPRLPSTPPEFVEGPFALKTLAKEHERTLEDVTVRLRRETRVVEEQGWSFPAYQRYFRYMSPALMNAVEDLLPWLQDPGAYHWETIKNTLVGYIRSADLDYPRLSDPAYFEAHRQDAVNLWEVLECVAQTLAAKWELGFGECQDNPNPNDLRLPELDPALEVGGWMLNHFPSLREGELPTPLERFVESYRLALQPQQMAENLQQMADRFGAQAVPDLFGEAWAERYGYEALLSDLERELATPEQLIGLGWLFNHRLMR